MNPQTEIYFACKQAFQTLSGKELDRKLQEIFTPETQAIMNQQERIFRAKQPIEEALSHAKEQAWKQS